VAHEQATSSSCRQHRRHTASNIAKSWMGAGGS
jgi:hypothetical protein